MIRTEYEEIERSPSTLTKKAIYESKDLADKTYEGIINKYTAYRFEEHIQLLRDEFGCQSYSYIIFFLCYQINNYSSEAKIFSSTLDIFSEEGVEYLTNNILYDDEDIKDFVEHIFNGNFINVYIKAEMETKFYLNRSLDIMNQYETEELEEIYDEGDDDEGYQDNTSNTSAIETPFVSDNCSVCLTAKPNILFFPCLHQSICYECEEVGKLIKCSVCREKIERKIKI